MQITEGHCDLFKHDGLKILERYQESFDWLSSIGLPFSKSRYGRYKQIIEQFAYKFDEINKENFEQKLYEFLNAHLEVTELIRIKNSFENSLHADFIEKLKKVTSGSLFRNQSRQDQSRDYSFELSVATRFLNAGYSVDISHMADVVTIVNNRKIFI